MHFEQDYMERVTKTIGNMLVAIAAGKDAVQSGIEDEIHDIKISEDDLLEIMVKKFISEGKINEAENIIYDAIKSRHTKKSYDIGIYFYNEINKFNDEKLLKCNFSREEILNGLEELKNCWNDMVK